MTLLQSPRSRRTRHAMRGRTTATRPTRSARPTRRSRVRPAATSYAHAGPTATQLAPQARGAGGRRPAAQQHAAVPDAQLLHRAAGRLPAARLGDARSRFARCEAGRRAVPAAASTRARARRSSPHVPWDAEQKARVRRAAVRRAGRPLRASTTRARALDVIVVDGEPAGRLLRATAATTEIRIVDIALLPSIRGRGIGQRPAARADGRGDARRQARRRSTSSSSTPRSGCTSGSASPGRGRARRVSAHGVGAG